MISEHQTRCIINILYPAVFYNDKCLSFAIKNPFGLIAGKLAYHDLTRKSNSLRTLFNQELVALFSELSKYHIPSLHPWTPLLTFRIWRSTVVTLHFLHSLFWTQTSTRRNGHSLQVRNIKVTSVARG